MLQFGRWLAFILMSSWVAIAAAAEPMTQPWRIVLLRSSDSQLPASVASDTAFRETLNARGETHVEVFPEDLDTWRFPEAELDAELMALLRKKHGKRPPHIVVASGSNALRFAERHHDELWPNATLIFKMVDDRSLDEIRPTHASYGVKSGLGIAETLGLASRLLPQTKRVVVVSGTAEFDREIEKSARMVAEQYRGRLEFEFMSDLPLAEVVARASAQPPGTILLVLTMFRDAAGQALAPVAVAARVAGAANVPSFYFLDTGIGRGVLGGGVAMPADNGRIAAELALSVLSGSAPPAPVIRQAPVRCILDWRQLERWGIDPDRVPADCEVRFRERSFLEQYWREALVAAAIIALQFVLIGLLVIQLRRRREAELETQRRAAEVAHAARLATVGELTAAVAHEINQPLGAILANADAAEMILEADPGATAEVRQVLDDIRADGLRASDVIKSIRTLLRRHDMQTRSFDVNDVIVETLALLRGDAARKGMRIATDLDPALPLLWGDPVHFQHVILNLVINAMDAMVGVPAERREVRVRTNAKGDDVVVAVEDAGPGVPPENLPHLFDSFFTTKESGLGLGLSIVRTIVEAHAGHVTAENRPEGGARVAIWLRAARP